MKVLARFILLLSIPLVVLQGCDTGKKLKEPTAFAPIASEPVEQTDVLESLPDVTTTGCTSELMQRVVYFDFDKSNIRGDAIASLEEVANCMREISTVTIKIIGHCDERGTEEYNLALGNNRAVSVMDYLQNQGISGDRIASTSRGELEPAVDGHDESAWALNRRVEFILVSE